MKIAIDGSSYLRRCQAFVRTHLLCSQGTTPGAIFSESRIRILGELASAESELSREEAAILRALAIYGITLEHLEEIRAEEDEIRFLRGSSEPGGKCQFCSHAPRSKDVLDAEARDRTKDADTLCDILVAFYDGKLDASVRARVDREGCGHGAFYRTQEALLCPGFEEDAQTFEESLAFARERREIFSKLQGDASRFVPEPLQHLLYENVVRLTRSPDDPAVWLGGFLGEVSLERIAESLPPSVWEAPEL